MKRLAYAAFIVAGGAGWLGCSSSPTDVSGSYTVAVTDEDNGCNLPNFTMGQSSTNIPVDVSQADTKVTLTITGLVGTYVSGVLGSNEFDGDVDGSHLSATLFGTKSATMSGCEFTFNADLEGDLAGDAMTGSIAYSPKTNGSPDCSSIEGCTSTQDFNGTRPPM